MKRTVLLFFLFTGLKSLAQERIDTDRPDQTESAVLVPKRYFQGEFGFGKENFEGENFNLIHPTFLLKYGLSNRFELRLESELSSRYLHLIPDTKKTIGLAPVEIGTKIALFKEKGLLPKTSLIAHVGLPFIASPHDKEQDVFPSFRFTFQNSITDRIGLGYNVGAEWDGYQSSPVWLYTFSPNINIGKRWYAYVEAFGFFESDSWQHNLDGGFAYYVTNDVKLDLSAGLGVGASLLRNYMSLGFSFRLQ